MIESDDDLLREFLIESHDNLDRYECDLVTLERDSMSADALRSLFRTVHTIKGTCGFLGLKTIESISHASESLLSRLADGAIAVDDEVLSALYRTGDVLRRMLRAVERGGEDGVAGARDVVSQLARLAKKEPLPTAAPKNAPRRGTTDSRRRDDAPASRTVRVDLPRLDELSRLVDDLARLRDDVCRPDGAPSGPLDVSVSRRMDFVTRRLHEEMARMRLQPIGRAWSRLPRLVQELAQECGKRVRLETRGDEIEIDRVVGEAIRDPLVHLVRNAIDHGIERPEDRAAAGKPAEGLLRVGASRDENRLILDVSDDGAGVDLDRVLEKASDRGLKPGGGPARPTDEEILAILFLPGFSTADAVSRISGRGVGLDVVKFNVEEIGGDLAVTTRRGLGVTVRMGVPLGFARSHTSSG